MSGTTERYDWGTIRACAAAFDSDPYELERIVDIGDRAIVGKPCSWLTGYGKHCGRGANGDVGGLPLCWQHQNDYIRSFFRWLRDQACNRDVVEVVESLRDRLSASRKSATWDEFDARADHALRDALGAYLDRDEVAVVREALASVWGPS